MSHESLSGGGRSRSPAPPTSVSVLCLFPRANPVFVGIPQLENGAIFVGSVLTGIVSDREKSLRDRVVGGSNPLAPTNSLSGSLWVAALDQQPSLALKGA